MRITEFPFRLLPAVLGSALLAAALVGCGKGGPPTPLSADQVPAAISKAFSSAKPDLKELADRAVSSLQAEEPGKALLVLEGICAAPDLTKEQRDVASRAVLGLNEQLQAAAAKGDARAVEFLKARQATK
jgi:hypothetical protein